MMGTRSGKVGSALIVNIDTELKEFTVARYWDGSYWYWGSWDSADDAESVAKEVGGTVFHTSALSFV